LVEEIRPIGVHKPFNCHCLRKKDSDVNAISLAGLLDKIMGLLWQTACVYGEDPGIGIDLTDHICKDLILWTKTAGKGHVLAQFLVYQPDQCLG
jgi:hypothetical protein